MTIATLRNSYPDPEHSFDELNHRYYVGAREIPGVSRLMETCGFKGWYPDGDKYKQRGDAVHFSFGLMAGFFPGRAYAEAGTHADLLPYTRGLQAFLSRTGYKPVLFEHRMHSTRLQFAGQMDTVGYFPGEDWLSQVDFKTGTLPAAVGIQMALYKMLAKDCGRLPMPDGSVKVGFEIKSNKSLLLPGNGEFLLSSFDEPRWMTIAQSILNIYNARRDLKFLREV